jgi:hypothetical protein
VNEVYVTNINKNYSNAIFDTIKGKNDDKEYILANNN